MRSDSFDPSKFINRDFEREEFERIVRGESSARVLAIRDGHDRGKSHLLRQFHYRCRTVRPRTPVSLIRLDEEDTTPLTLVMQLHEDFTRQQIPFPTFEDTLLERGGRGDVILERNDFRDARRPQIAGTINNVEGDQVVNMAAQRRTREQRRLIEEECIRAFFEDLKEAAAEAPVVIMLDTFEQADEDTVRWITEYLLELHFFEAGMRPERLVLVVAGTKAPDFHGNWPPEQVGEVISSVEKLGDWDREHVQECLRVHGHPADDETVDAIYRLVQQGLAPSLVVEAVKGLSPVREAS